MCDEGPRGAACDLWTLLAVAYAGDEGRGVGLDAVGHLAGILRQATLTEAVLRDELDRLEESGLVERREGKYHPTGAFLALFRARSDRRSVREDYEGLRRFLGRTCPGGECRSREGGAS